MEAQKYKRVTLNQAVENYLIFKVTPEKKLLNLIRELKDVFPQQKKWDNLTDRRAEKEAELLDKFQKRGKLYRKICQNWMNNNMPLAQEFNDHFENLEKEINTEDVLKFFETMKKKHNLNIMDIVLFIHIYVEQAVGVQLFEESALKIEKELASARI